MAASVTDCGDIIGEETERYRVTKSLPFLEGKHRRRHSACRIACQGEPPNPLTLQVNKSERNDENEQRKSHQKHERDQWKEYERMAEKEEVRYYSDNKIEINGKIYNVTFTFPLPKDETETAYDKLKHLINGEKVN